MNLNVSALESAYDTFTVSLCERDVREKEAQTRSVRKQQKKCQRSRLYKGVKETTLQVEERMESVGNETVDTKDRGRGRN